ncbi:MAG: hypothetical protein WC445_01845 [Patescibacteria group bacterium]
MENEKNEKCDYRKWRGPRGSICGFYFLTVIGTAVYFVQQSHGFWAGVLGVLKAIVWPAFLAYRVFSVLGA